MLPQPPEGYQPTQQKKPNWLQKLAQLHKDAEVNRQVQSGQKRLEAWKKSQRKKGFGTQKPIDSDTAVAYTSADEPKTSTKPKPAKKRSTIPSWMQRRIDRQMDMIDVMVSENERVSDEKSKKDVEDAAKEMDKLVSILSRSQIPYATEGLKIPYSEEELAVVKSKNVASKMQYDKAHQRYNELADKYGLPRFGDKEVKTGDTEKDFEKVNVAELDLTDPQTFKNDAYIKAMLRSTDPKVIAALDSAMTPALDNNQNIDKAGSDPSWINDALKKLVGPLSKKHKEQDSAKQQTAERRSTIAKARRLGYNWTQKELSQYNKTGVLPAAVKKLLNKAK